MTDETYSSHIIAATEILPWNSSNTFDIVSSENDENGIDITKEAESYLMYKIGVVIHVYYFPTILFIG